MCAIPSAVLEVNKKGKKNFYVIHGTCMNDVMRCGGDLGKVIFKLLCRNMYVSDAWETYPKVIMQIALFLFIGKEVCR